MSLGRRSPKPIAARVCATRICATRRAGERGGRSAWRGVALALAVALLAEPSAPVLAVPRAGATWAAPARLAIAMGKRGAYIVQMAGAPVVSYVGGIPGMRATRPGHGRKIDPEDADVERYRGTLAAKHDAALAGVGGAHKLHDYAFALDGFAAQLTPAQAGRLAARTDVLAVWPDELRQNLTTSTPTFLGLDAPGGLWEQPGSAGEAGEGIVIGLIDSGVWPESPSFSDRTGTNGNGSRGGKLDFRRLPGWHGHCVPGEAFQASDCSQKLIGARWFNQGFGGDEGLKAERPWEFASARDYGGHGTHTASTAGGDRGVAFAGPASVFSAINGMAPRARIAVYKALWSRENDSLADGFTSDILAAIDQAVADGVDVLNYSVSGTRSSFLDPVEIAFLSAAEAGVFVAASAGNSGPAVGTVIHPAPWLTTVAADTHDRLLQGSVTAGNGVLYRGASLARGVGPAPLIVSTAAGLPGADPGEVSFCFPGTLDPSRVAARIVVCDRGVIARVEQSRAVALAGGVGMVLVNVAPGSLNAEFHAVPTVHLPHTDRAALRAYATTSGATATIDPALVLHGAAAPFTASFSSRGPLLAGGGDLLKPDLIAPGRDILAAVAPTGNGGRSVDFYSGTSMSSPHVAGIAALLRNLHPDWSPMAVKSALMTSAGDVLDGPSTQPFVIFREGAGHVRPNAAVDPGLIYDAGSDDWQAFLCGSTSAIDPAECRALADRGFSTDPSDLNTASIAIGDLPGAQTVTRRVTNVGGSPASYTVTVAGMSGVEVAVSPSAIALDAGETASFRVRFATTTAPLQTYAGGTLTWSDGTHEVRIPMVVRPVPLVVPTTVFGTGGALAYDVRFGYTGSFTVMGRGLVPATALPGSVAGDPGHVFAPGGPGTARFDVSVPPGTTYARFALFDRDVSPPSDLDLYVYRDGGLVGASTGGTSVEEVSFANPPARTYSVWVHGAQVPAGGAAFTLLTWALGTTSAGNLAVSAPAAATAGQTGAVVLGFGALAPGASYLGSVAYAGAPGLPAPTIVRIDTFYRTDGSSASETPLARPGPRFTPDRGAVATRRGVPASSLRPEVTSRSPASGPPR